MYVYPVADKYNINPKIYYFKRKYKAELFVKNKQIERIEEMNRLSIRQGISLLDSDYVCYELMPFIKTED